jgi:hypothetical protein
MSLAIVIAFESETTKTAVLYAGHDADAAKEILLAAEGPARSAGLKGAVRVEMYRRPPPYKRREVFIAEQKRSK